MKRFIFTIILVFSLAIPASALEMNAPELTGQAQEIIPEAPETFGEGLWKLVKAGIAQVRPDLRDSAGTCLSLIGAVLLISLVKTLPGAAERVVTLVGTVSIGLILLGPSSHFIELGVETVRELSDYGKLLLPVMTGAMAAEGGVTASAALYAGTAAFDTILGSLISALIVPLLYVFLALAVAHSAVGEDVLKKMQDFAKWLITWGLKIILYVFTGFMAITGVASGTTDAAALKATKLTISGMVPVVGNILSDASEAVLVSAGVMKNAAGIYGLLAILAICIVPFLRIGIQYLLLKLTAAVCGAFGIREATDLINSVSTAMGLLLAMTGTTCLLLLISTVCFMRGVG